MHRINHSLDITRDFVLLAPWLLSTAMAAPSFTGVSFLSPPPGQSIAFDVSADGNTVVGESIAPQGFEAFRWTQSEGIVGLGFFPNPGGFKSSQAFAANSDGSVIVGTSLLPNCLLEDGGSFRWTAATGLEWLGNLGGTDTGGIAQGITPDGTTIVGWCASTTIYRAFRWTESTGMLDLGLLPDEELSKAFGVTEDAAVIVGYVSLGSLGFPEAYVWTAEAGKVLLPVLNDDTISSANAITPDGSIIVGDSAGLAVRWINDTVQSLGVFPDGGGTSTYHAHAVSGDGAIITGLGDFSATLGLGRAFIWDEVNGMRDLRDVLVDEFHLGDSLAGWTLFDARGISADGNVIAGYGFDPQGTQQGWVADLRIETEPCDGDANGDETVDPLDAGYVLSRLGCLVGAGDPECDAADVNADVLVDPLDVGYVLARFGECT